MSIVHSFLYRFQHEAVRKIESFGGRALLADEMGLGKTHVVLEWLRIHPERRPALIVTPASVKYNWQSIAREFFRLNIRVLEGSNAWGAKNYIQGQDLWLLNYDILRAWSSFFSTLSLQCLVLDEAHYLKSLKTIRTGFCLQLASRVPHVIALTGTPLVNRPLELFPILRLVRPDLFSSFHSFAWRYCAPRRTPWGWDYKGCSRPKELHRMLLDTCMIRRLKRDVMPELEDKSRQIQILQLEDKSLEEYLQASDDFLAWLKAISPARALRAARCEALTRIGYLMRLVARLKLPQSQRWIENFLSSHPEAKLVAFSCYHQVLDYLHEKFSSEAVLVDGRVTGLRRIESVRRFQSLPQIRLFLGNWRAAGVGVTLTAAHHVLALDLPWTPGELIQAEDRIHRIGQKRQSCIHYLIAKDTIEYRLVRVLQQKSAILSKILEGGETVSDLDIFRTLLHQMNDEYSRSIERSTD